MTDGTRCLQVLIKQDSGLFFQKQMLILEQINFLSFVDRVGRCRLEINFCEIGDSN
jgi:hypothetical protein